MMIEPSGTYFVSAYVSKPGLAHTLQAWTRHDHAIALWRIEDKRIVLQRYWELERLTGVKGHGIAFKRENDLRDFVRELLAHEGVSPDEDVPMVGLTESAFLPWRTFNLPLHTLSHLASTLFMDTEYLNKGGVVVGMALDDTPDEVLESQPHDNWYAGAVVSGTDLQIFPVESPAKMYSAAVHVFGIREGTLMALSTACGARLTEPIDWSTFKFFGNDSSRDAELEALIANALSSTLEEYDDRFSDAENRISAIMKEIQRGGAEVIRRNLRSIFKNFPIDPRESRLALAGGYALNCPTNSAMVEEFGFTELQAPPFVSDSGQAYGLGLLACMSPTGPWPSHSFPGSYVGREHSSKDYLARWREFIVAVDSWTPETVVADLRRDVVGWFQGCSEVGPRALGNRSILGDPTRLETKTRLNDIKRRAWWRPVAPVVSEEGMDDWFEGASTSSYMLRTFLLRPEVSACVPAIAHLDQSARVQTLTSAENPALHNVIRAAHTEWGVPMVANTSMNDNEEPIVDTPEEAITFCLSRGVSVLYINDLRLVLDVHAGRRPKTPALRNVLPFIHAESGEREGILEEENPHGLSDEILMGWLYSPEYSHLDITQASDAKLAEVSVRQKMADDDVFRTGTQRRLRKVRHLGRDGRPVFGGGWISNGET